jgi:hypothetical protein
MTVVLRPPRRRADICVRRPVKQFAFGAKQDIIAFVLKSSDPCLGGFVIHGLVVLKDCEVAFLLALENRD